MSNYRVYCHANGKIMKAHWIEARDDEDALAQAREFDLGAGCEVWQGARQVGSTLTESGTHEGLGSSYGDGAQSI